MKDYWRQQAEYLELVLHAVLRRHHPNGAEISNIVIDSDEHHNYKFIVSDNHARGSMIISSVHKNWSKE